MSVFHKKVNYTNESIFIKKRLIKNHELIKHFKTNCKSFYARTVRIF